MKAEIKLFLVILMSFVLTGCNSYDNDAYRIELYILRYVEGSDDLVIDEKPIITGEDILSYEWDTHTITFKDEFLLSREINETKDDLVMGGSKILDVYYPDQFALYLDGEELFRGYMMPQAFISFMPIGPVMSNAPDGIIIKNYNNESDIRESEELHEILKNNGLLQ